MNKTFVLLIFILLMSIYSDEILSVPIAKSQIPNNTSIVSESINLGISRTITEVETSFKRNLVLSRVWDRILLNMSVQNFGDQLDSISLNVKTNGAPVKATFRKSEQVGLIQAYSYQFELPQILSIILNYTGQTEIQLEILLQLDHDVSWRDPLVDFYVQEARLILLDLGEPWESQLLYNADHLYQIQPVKYSFLEKDLLASLILFVHMPPQMQLLCTISIRMQPIGVNYLKVDDQTLSVSKGSHSIRFNSSLTKTDKEPLFLLISPDYESLSETTRIVLSISVVGIYQSRSTYPFGDILGSHPVPGVLMIPLLLIGFFGVPYYMIYREHLTEREQTILDPKKQTKL